MRRTFTRLSLVSIVGCAIFVACHDDAPKSNVTLKWGETTAELRYGKALPTDDGVVLQLSTAPVKCGEDNPENETGSLRLLLPAGPGGGFFSGAPTGYETTLKAGERVASVPRRLRTASFEPVTLNPGERLRGALDFDVEIEGSTVAAHGKVDVEICKATHPIANSRIAAAPPGEVTGSFAGKPLTFRSAIARLETDPKTGESYVASLRLSARSRAFCSDSVVGAPGDLDIDVVAGTLGKGPPLGKPQPAQASVRGASLSAPPGVFGGSLHAAWVEFEAGEYRPGATLVGAVVVESGPGAKPGETGRLAGHFSAKVCPSYGEHPVPALSNVTLSVDAKGKKLSYGIARLTPDGLRVMLADVPDVRCSASPPFGKDATALSFEIPPGPEAKFYAGQKTGTPLELWAPMFHTQQPGTSVDLWRDQASVQMQPFELEEFAHVKGKLSASFKYQDPSSDKAPVEGIELGGDFDVELCVDAPEVLDSLNALPKSAPDTPVSGTMLGEPFSSKRAYASLSREKANGSDVIWAVSFYADPAVKCLSIERPSLDITFPGGTSSAALLLGTVAAARSPNAQANLGLHGDGAWIRFESIEFRPGGKVKGEVVAASRKGAAKKTLVAGKFEATVCKTQ